MRTYFVRVELDSPRTDHELEHNLQEAWVNHAPASLTVNGHAYPVRVQHVTEE